MRLSELRMTAAMLVRLTIVAALLTSTTEAELVLDQSYEDPTPNDNMQLRIGMLPINPEATMWTTHERAQSFTGQRPIEND